jgi:hypothetical protein
MAACAVAQMLLQFPWPHARWRFWNPVSVPQCMFGSPPSPPVLAVIYLSLMFARRCLQVVAEWELFLLTSVGYSATVRRAARERLDAIHARDSETLHALHREVAAVLSGPLEAPTPTPLPTPLPMMPPEGLSRCMCSTSIMRSRRLVPPQPTLSTSHPILRELLRILHHEHPLTWVATRGKG